MSNEAADTAAKLVERIISDLTDRSGMEWDDLDSATQAEIRATWRRILTPDLQVGVDALALLARIQRTDALRTEDEELYDEVHRFLGNQKP